MFKAVLIAAALLTALPTPASTRATVSGPVADGVAGIVRLSAISGSNTGPRLNAMYEDRPGKAGSNRALTVVVRRSRPNFDFRVILKGQIIGQLRTDALGLGVARFQSTNGAPNGLPKVSPNDMIVVGPLKAQFQ